MKTTILLIGWWFFMVYLDVEKVITMRFMRVEK